MARIKTVRGTWGNDDDDRGNGPGHTVNCRCVVEPVRRAYFQACADAMPVEVLVLGRLNGAYVVAETVRGALAFAVLAKTATSVGLTNVAPVRVEDVRLLEVKR